MAITLSRLFANTEKNYHIKLIAGQRGMKNLVRWVHMVEDSEVPGFLHGNELILTTGIAHKGTDWLVDFVRSLINHRAIGLIVNLGPYIAEVPKNVIRYCDENEFPLFVVPWKIHLIDVTFDFCHRIIANEENETSIATAFRNLIFSNENKETYSSTLDRRGFHFNTEYTLLIMNAKRREFLFSGDEWYSLRFQIQSILKNTDKPFCTFVQENNLVLIGSELNSQQMEEYARMLIQEVFGNIEDIKVNTGISESIIGYSRIKTCYKQALTALNTTKLINETILQYKDTGIYKLLYAVEDMNVLRLYMNGTVQRIEEYDQLHHTDYLATLKCYIDNDGSIQKVSSHLNVHRNTINYKIKAMKELFSLELNYKDITNLSIAFYIRNIMV
ncbi:MAG: Purine catabolism regulatory protein-like family [Anaerocolumna sp.]|jgi:hypothetical protein|nr:Purine catabolism regulatory protein-like family [Anaerocolumna sp.]